jgi:hypothetical protein
MKYLIAAVTLFALPVLAQTAPALPALPGLPALATAVAAAATPSLLDILTSHLGVISAVLVAVLDLVFALNPKANAPDGLLHMVYLLLTSGKLTQTPVATTPTATTPPAA